MTIGIGDRGALVAKTNFIVAYAFHHDTPQRLADPTDRIATARREVEYLLYEDSDGKLWPGAANGFTYLMDCAAAKEGLLAPTFGRHRVSSTTGPTAKHDESYYLDPKNPITDESCT
ncbi:hypothetical protein NLX83_16830 [Allokutzneria sp. A3M-2-11 16]|uniref:hypothetical protein n=1 Tax=Allokutzneria sp. A3M-2-11 16 TaxID=2962043 RepID=UPI0020B6B360|nr:hypothetical protein [Allokutzneria sp. A3M-2-11 16]MCP3800930.1 hypothetical protein [Allokutzneria sp. A3M-2-11 16]